MAKKVKVKLNRNEVSNQLLKGAWIDSVMEEIAQGVVSQCSGNYNVESFSGQKRDNVSIFTDDKKTFFVNLKTNELLKALGGKK